MLDVSIVIPTYFPGKIINNLFKSLPKVKEILVLDNSSDEGLKNLITNNYNYVDYHDLGDVGLSKTFNYALKKTISENIFITQPDVTLNFNCLDELLKAKKIYDNAAILSPLVFKNNEYCYVDSPPLKLNKKKELVSLREKKIIKEIPVGDISVEAVTSTAILLDKNKIINIGGWDNFYYTYLEDIDLSLNVRKNGYEIIKVKKAKVEHMQFASHTQEMHDQINQKRILNFARSSIYFKKKYLNKKNFLIYFLKNLFFLFFKIFFNILFFQKKKRIINIIKIKQFIFF